MKSGPLAAAAVALLVLLAAACSSNDSAIPGQSAQTGEAETGPTRPDRVPLIEGPVSPDGVRAILGTADLGVGANRFGFVLTADGFVTAPSATVFSRYFASASAEGELRQIVRAEYQPWPYGSRGLYATELEFDRAGSWGIDVSVQAPDGSLQSAQLFFEVAESPSAPAVGEPAIKSTSKIVADVDSLEQLATGSLLDPDLYRTTIAEALASGRPTVVVFASPAFCTNAVCGPQIEVLQQLKDKYSGQANFIHVDFYDNPDEIQGDLDRARLSPVVLEWRLPSIEWTFVVDGAGIVSARFEAFATFNEVEEELRRVL